MPCLTENYSRLKLVTVFRGNTNSLTINGLVVLNCNHTSKIKALIDGTYLTDVRSVAIGGLAVQRLANKMYLGLPE